jgi:glycosyltransferase involved in cell wall biosynthesis
VLSLGYACGSLRVSIDDNTEATGARAHVVGFLGGLRAAGIEPKVYLAGEERFAHVVAPGNGGRGRHVLPRRVAFDAARLGLRFVVRREARKAIGGVDVLYERHATFQEIGRAFQRRGALWVIESNGPFWYEASEEHRNLAFVEAARRLELRAYRDADLVVAVTAKLKDIIVRESGCDEGDVYVLPNAANVAQFDPSRVTPVRLVPSPVIGFCGYMTRWAGLDNLISVLAEMRRLGRGLNAVLVGDGPARAELERQAQHEGLASSIRFTGHVPWGDIPALLAGFDIGFSGQRQMKIGAMYHSPLKIYEYQAMGLPVIASDHADARTLVAAHDAGWLFASDDRGDLLRAVKLALDDRDFKERGRRGRLAVIEHHTWEVRVRQLLTELDRRRVI